MTAIATAVPRRRAPAGTAISVDNVSKTFRLPHQQFTTLKERALHPFRASTYDELHAVREVSLEIGEGEFFGIVGRNGSGKSTLLKCLAGIYDIDSGRIRINGRLSPFIELGVGFNPDLTARDNVVINAIMLGLSRRQARDRFDDIIAFAELEEFIDLKLKNYSSGMYVRLAFAVAIQVDADIVLIDEVLAVGDANFQQKCFDEFNRMKREGKTIVFVTHDMSAVERFCDRALLIERGRVLEQGEPRAITRSYNALNFGRLVHEVDDRDAISGATTITSAWFENERHERVGALAIGERMRVCFEAEVGERLVDPVIAMTLRNEAGHAVLAGRSDQLAGPSGTFEQGTTVTVAFEVENWLAPSRYSISPSIARSGSGADVVALGEDMASLVVHGIGSGGVLELPQQFEVHRS